MKKVVLMLVLLCGYAVCTVAQNFQEVVYLKNGSILRGVIIEQVPNQSVKIQTADGNIFSYFLKKKTK